MTLGVHSAFFIGDKVYNKFSRKKGKVVDFKYINYSRAYLVRYSRFSLLRKPFKKEEWCYGIELELVKRKENKQCTK